MDGDGMAPYDYGATATFSCDEGFHLNGAYTRTCGDGTGTLGIWNGSEPICDRMFVQLYLGLIVTFSFKLYYK